jgi:hypothetical protein
MKRVLYVLGFTLWGILATFVLGNLVIELEGKGFIPKVSNNACWETLDCETPWFISLWIFVCLLLPTAVHAVAGWSVGKGGAKPRRAIICLLALAASTFIFYLVAHLVESAVRGG